MSSSKAENTGETYFSLLLLRHLLIPQVGVIGTHLALYMCLLCYSDMDFTIGKRRFD